MPQTEDQFKKILIESIDHALLILGTSIQKSIYFHLKKDYSLTRENIPENMEAFSNGLKSIFGAGGLVIERLILENLCLKLGLKYEKKKNFRFIEGLNRAREAW